MEDSQFDVLQEVGVRDASVPLLFSLRLRTSTNT